MSKNALKIAAGLDLSQDAVTNTFGIIGVRGAGKTFTAKKMAEEMLKQQHQIICIDPVGVWHGLRSSSDGKKPGLSILVLGGEHGDIAIDHTQGARVAELVVEHRYSVVLDLSDMRKGQAVTFLTFFCETLYRLKARSREPLHMFMDEADVYAPQVIVNYGGDGGNPQRLLGAVEDLVRRGRSRGIGITLISQRAAKLNKNVLTQIETLFALRITSPQDRAAIKAWAEGNGTPEQQKVMLDSLASLKTGQAWVWSPSFIGVFKQVSIDRIETFDSSSTPEVGKQVKVATATSSIDLEQVRAALAPPEPKAKTKPEPARKAEPVEVSVFTDADRERLEGIASNIAELRERMLGIDGALDKLTDELRPLVVKAISSNSAAPPQPIKRTAIKRDTGREVSGPTPANNGTDEISKPQQLILNTIAEFNAVGIDIPDKANIAAWCGVSHKSGSYANNLGRLRSLGLIDYGQGGAYLTDAGRALAVATENIATLSDLHAKWAERLSGPQRSILEYLTSKYPEPVNRTFLAEWLGVSATSGSYANNLGAMRSLGIIDYPERGQVIATALLFPTELRSASIGR